MEILIKNMKIPKNCDTCIFLFLGSVGRCFFSGCRCVKSRRPNGCPLVEVKPHGRLIDADKLLNGLSDCEIKSYGYNGSCDDCEDRNICGVRVLRKDIEDAPTVLEASNGTDNQG